MSSYTRVQRTNYFKLKKGVTLEEAKLVLGITDDTTYNADNPFHEFNRGAKITTPTMLQPETTGAYALSDWEIPSGIESDVIINTLTSVMAENTVLIHYEVGYEGLRYMTASIAIIDLKEKRISYTDDLIAKKIEAIFSKYGCNIPEVNKQWIY